MPIAEIGNHYCDLLFPRRLKLNRQASAASPSKLLRCRTLKLHLTTLFLVTFFVQPTRALENKTGLFSSKKYTRDVLFVLPGTQWMGP